MAAVIIATAWISVEMMDAIDSHALNVFAAKNSKLVIGNTFMIARVETTAPAEAAATIVAFPIAPTRNP